ncbi:hypothetical protein SDC9_87673 [bioreactor metagenome]|uniref:Uncharacterized protein n=1 Tax=bioreactor metagenome TaxID=1076179 RepID=A0A644ZTX6_9ZZZZ
MRRPSWEPRSDPASRAVGVARPSAQGQLMISTDTAAVTAKVADSPRTSQTTSVISASTMTIGTKTPEILSASAWERDFPVWASSTRWAIWASWVSAPTAVARTTNRPVVLTEAPTTALPGWTSTGSDSPVMTELSIAESPLTTTPSVAIFSPGRTTNSSSTTSFSIGTVTSAPPRKTVTDLAPTSARARSAELAS